MVQIALTLCDGMENRLESSNFIIKPENYTIPENSAKVHGITTRKALIVGIDLYEVLTRFIKIINKADFIVAHNIVFDEKIVNAECIRTKISTNLARKRKICTMESSIENCKIDGNYGYKWPKLSELCRKLFGEHLHETHNAAKDVSATERCFWQMKKN